MKTDTKPTPSVRDIPTGVWALGLVSMLMDISSEMIHSLLPVYLVTVLGTSMITVGLIEGIAEGTASITKVFSGALSDWLGKRKLLVAIGYGLAALTKPVFPLAATVGWVVSARFVDRIGKGIRGAPRDALIADISPVHLRGASFGLRQSLDTTGAFIGPLLAIGLMWWTANNFRAVFWFAVIPAFLALALILFAVREPARPEGLRNVRNPISLTELSRFEASYWWVVAIATAFTLARFSEAFLILRAQNVGLPIMLVPAVLVVMNVVYAFAAYPAGVLSDRMNRMGLLALGIVLLVAADLVLALLPTMGGLALGVALWGLHMGFTQGLFATLIAGALWDVAGPQGTFFAGACFALIALVGLLAVQGKINNKVAA
jgi:MFS family permease